MQEKTLSPTAELPVLMSVYELMEYLHCSKDTAYSLVKAKTFPSLQLGSRWYVIKDDLPDWLRNQSKKLKYCN